MFIIFYLSLTYCYFLFMLIDLHFILIIKIDIVIWNITKYGDMN